MSLVIDENSAGPFPLRRVRLEPASEFAGFDALELHFVFGIENKIAVPLTADGEHWRLPPCPAVFGRIRVSDRTGSILHHRVVIAKAY